jgi:hypothetical protein
MTSCYGKESFEPVSNAHPKLDVTELSHIERREIYEKRMAPLSLTSRGAIFARSVDTSTIDVEGARQIWPHWILSARSTFPCSGIRHTSSG